MIVFCAIFTDNMKDFQYCKKNKGQRRKSDIQRRSNGKLPKESLTYGEVHRASDEIARRVERVANELE